MDVGRWRGQDRQTGGVGLDVVWWVIGAGVAGVGAGVLGRVLLGRLRRGALVSAPWCEVCVAVAWAVAAGRAAAGGFPLWWLPMPLALGWFAVLLSATDLTHQRLPDVLTLPAYPLVVGFLLVAGRWGAGPGVSFRAVLGGLALAGLYAVVHLVAPRSLGGGDVKLAGSVGAVLGAVSWTALLLGPVLAAALTLGLVVVRRNRQVAYGPGLLGASWMLITFPTADALSAL